MATRPQAANPHAARRSKPCTRSSLARPVARKSRYKLQPACDLRPSADLAGRPVRLSTDLPVEFDVPLAPHHKLIGRWAAGREHIARRYTRQEARRRIERVFDQAVLEILKPIELVNLRAAVLVGDDDNPPALTLICDDIGQLDLGWIEKSNLLRDALAGPVAPLGWRAAAYKALSSTLSCALPIFNFEDLMDELSCYHWDGETDDESARRALIEYRGYEPAEVDGGMLPSAIRARRPDFMLPENADPLKNLPKGLRQRVCDVRKAHAAVKALNFAASPWTLHTGQMLEYIPYSENWSHFPPLTVVPVENFALEVDYVTEHGMHEGFVDLCGICPLTDARQVDEWLASLKVGADFLLAAQALIDIDPAKL